MKARVKATGEIVEVREEYDLREEGMHVFYSNEEDPHKVYEIEELDFNVNDNINPTIDYWAMLEHQYAGMAMQGMLANANHYLWERKQNYKSLVANAAELAHALVEKLKEKEE